MYIAGKDADRYNLVHTPSTSSKSSVRGNPDVLGSAFFVAKEDAQPEVICIIDFWESAGPSGYVSAGYSTYRRRHYSTSDVVRLPR